MHVKNCQIKNRSVNWFGLTKLNNAIRGMCGRKNTRPFPAILGKAPGQNCLFVFVALRPKSTAMVIAGRSGHLTTLFPGQA